MVRFGLPMRLIANVSNGEAIVSYVGEFILGSIALLAIAVAYWAIKQLKDAKNQHIEALNIAADKKDSQTEKHAEAYERMVTATVSAIEKLTATENTQTEAIRGLTEAVDGLRTSVNAQQATLDSVIRDAVRTRRVSGRSSDRWPAVAGSKPRGGEDK